MGAIEIKSVSKSFGETQALRDVSLTFEEGKIYGLLGRNGAGKSTLLNILTNRLFADSGEVLVDGESAVENDRAQGKIYLMSELNCYPETMRVRHVYQSSERFYPAFDAEYALSLSEQFKLDTKKKIKGLSTGYTSIYKLITGLSTNAPYLLLDEPVLGLDAHHRDLFYRILLEKYASSKMTVLLSTHLVEEVSSIIENVIIIKDGSIIRNEPTEEILKQGYTVTGPASEVDSYTSGKNLLGADSIGGLKTAYLTGRPGDVPDTLEVSRLDLQKLFIQLTNS